MNKFGGDWTKVKIDILVEYARAYLVIMAKMRNRFPSWKFMYFDGFAGSGLIVKGEKEDRKEIVGAARRILELEYPIPFDRYYFVELDSTNTQLLHDNTVKAFPLKTIGIAQADCNQKIRDMAKWLGEPGGKGYKVLAYIDPYGMQLDWSSLVAISKYSIDLWVLVPTGLGANRLLTRDHTKITDSWMHRLERFLGLSEQEIRDHFYKSKKEITLFGVEEKTFKEEDAIEKCATLYASRLGAIFKFVSKSFVLKNSQGSVMFHYLMVSNNKTAVRIANDIVKKYNE